MEASRDVLVLAVAVLVGEDFGGGVRLVAADSEVDADVADVGGDEGVYRLSLVRDGGHMPAVSSATLALMASSWR